MLRGVFFVAAAIGSACTFGSPGTKGDTAGSIAGEDTGDDDDTGMSSAPGDDGDGGGTAGMGSGTGMATGGLPGEGSSSTMPVDPDASATDDGISSGGVEPTTSSTGEPVDPTTDAGSSDDGGGPDPYPPCGQQGECPDGSTCVLLYDQFGVTAAFCGESGCGNANDCGLPSSGNASVDCVGLQNGGTACVLSCENGETCPAGMTCPEISGPEFCWFDF